MVSGNSSQPILLHLARTIHAGAPVHNKLQRDWPVVIDPVASDNDDRLVAGSVVTDKNLSSTSFDAREHCKYRLCEHKKR
jgi:hypothetical protein